MSWNLRTPQLWFALWFPFQLTPKHAHSYCVCVFPTNQPRKNAAALFAGGDAAQRAPAGTLSEANIVATIGVLLWTGIASRIHGR